jgi:hypothetical protein
LSRIGRVSTHISWTCDGYSTKSRGVPAAPGRHLGQQVVQRVAELVEQRLGVVERDQDRLAGAPLTKLLLFDVIGLISLPVKVSWLR